MKHIAIIAALALAAASSANAATPTLSSNAQVTLSTLAPELDTDSLDTLQVKRLNRAVVSDEGLNHSELQTILRN
ncbi:hypothetical protein [Falsirhodobacter sp. alg1]|uniref:hypothetical protein n=1 Tax=Falsirhodobacter sp. alg1 TaxID=1472418 RepID=UPI0005ED484B|nr:hypothetical protein [Falsirhodobacter sp. alg1]